MRENPLFGLQQAPLWMLGRSKLNNRFVMPCFATRTRQLSEIEIARFSRGVLDYRCPYCKKLTNIIADMRADNVRIVYKEWPILGDSSLLAARAGLAADKQGKYLAFHTRLMNSRLIPTATYIDESLSRLD